MLPQPEQAMADVGIAGIGFEQNYDVKAKITGFQSLLPLNGMLIPAYLCKFGG